MKDQILYRIVRPLIFIWFSLTYRPVFINNQIIPKKGRVIIAGNHASKMDIFLVMAATKRCLTGVTKAELFKGPGKLFFGGLGAIPVNREEKSNDVVAKCVVALNEEKIVGLMPEGTINRTDNIIMPFKTGAVRMALESNSSIIPFAIICKIKGNYRSFKRGVKIVFGELYYPQTKDVIKETKILEAKVIQLLKSDA